MPAFQFGSNLPIILLIIVILLVCLYFYLDMRKVKVLLENLDNKNETIVKEIDNIHLQMHKFFSRMPQSIVPRKANPNMTQNIAKKEPTEQILKEESEVSEELNQEKEKEKKPHLPKDTTEISENDFNNLKKQPHSNNIFGEVGEMISNNNNNNFLGDESEPIEPPPLVPFEYDSTDKVEKGEVDDDDGDDDVDDDDGNDDDDDDGNDIGTTDDEVDDEVDDVDGEVDLLPPNKDNIIDEYKLEEYMKMSVKGLKAKCIEMNLQHSGNKSTLAKRIVVNL